MQNYKMKNAMVFRKGFKLENGIALEFSEWRLESIEDVERGLEMKCLHCGGKVAAHKGEKLDHHFEHTKGQGDGCPIHNDHFENDEYIDVTIASVS